MKKKGAMRTVVGILLLIIFAEAFYLGFIKNPLRVGEDAPSAAEAAVNTYADNRVNDFFSKLFGTDPKQQTTPAPQGTEKPAKTEPGPSEEPEPETPTPGPEAPASNTDIPDKTDALPDIDITSWEYMLVNAANNIGEYTPDVTELEGQNLDSRIIEPMKEFVAAARAEGLSVYLSSGYRDYATQLYLYNRKVNQVGDPEYAATIVAKPGTSEHQTGLACDITDQYYDPKTQDLENTELFQWMSKHCQEYGFIVRYPKGSEDITGIMYEPWHFRYVGVEAATYIMEHSITLEEFVELYK